MLNLLGKELLNQCFIIKVHMVNVSVSRDTPQRHVIQDRTSLFISSSFAPAVTAPRLAIKIKPGTHASSKCICFDGSLNCPVFSLF